MFEGLLGGLLSGVSSLFNYNSQKKYQQQQLQLAQQQMDMQREFAQHGISWKVADSIASGIHPLVGLGASTSSPSPVSIGGSAPQIDLGSMGQDIGRALKAAQPEEIRAAQDERELRKLQLERGRLENDALRISTIGKIRREAVGVGPQMPLVSNTPSDRIPLPLPGPPRSPEGHPIQEDEIKQKPDDVPELPFSRPYGFKMWHNPYLSDAQTYENRYGDSELASMLKWGVNTIGDTGYSVYMNYPFLPPLKSHTERSRRPWISREFKR